MLEYFTFKKVKKHRAEKAEKERVEKENSDKQEKTKVEGKDGTSSDQATVAVAEPAEGDADTPTSPPPTSSPAPPVTITKPEDIPKNTPIPVLEEDDERFLERLTSSPESRTPTNDNDDETPPPLPPRIKTPVIEWDSDASSVGSRQGSSAVAEDDKSKSREKDKDNKKGKGKEKEKDKKDKATADPAEPKNKRFSFVTNLGRGISLRKKPGHTSSSGQGDASSLKPAAAAAAAALPESEVRKEEAEIARVLDDLNLAASSDDKKTFSLPGETADLVRRFTQVLKDLANGVPTAYGDLVQLVDDRDGVIERAYGRLPKGLRKLVAQLPDQLTSKLAPELLAVAAEAQGLSAEEGKDGGLKGAAKRFLTPSNLQELVTKPGAIAGLLKGIVNALKTRWPAFIGTNVLWSVAVFLLLSVLWYCYKRGREVRLEGEATEAAAAAATGDIDDSARVEELPDDPQLPAPGAPSTATRQIAGAEEDNEHVKVFPPASPRETVTASAPARTG
ncbi:hypothetical protein SLS62_007722 [Diatrype stigma]|uniref:Ring-like domain-containing protein n=1 Tax=Diatrype stigma TaxID=117547 RepID=A0AAN9ULF8_9PEZI